jgi:peptidyl-prolyl cis-trans isomerase D
MQAFRNAAKPLMVVVALTFFAWLVVDLSGITGSTGLLTKTTVGKVNGQSVDARTYQAVVQQSIDARQREAPAALGLEDYQQIRDQVWEQFVQNNVLQAEYKRRGIQVSEDEIVEAMRTSPT